MNGHKLFLSFFLISIPACTAVQSMPEPVSVKLPLVCEKAFVVPAPPSLPPVPTLTPDELNDRKKAEEILVGHIALLRKQNALYFDRVDTAAIRYRRLCK